MIEQVIEQVTEIQKHADRSMGMINENIRLQSKLPYLGYGVKKFKGISKIVIDEANKQGIS